MGALYQPAELVIIGGAGDRGVHCRQQREGHQRHDESDPVVISSFEYTKSMYMDLLALLLSPDGQITQQGMFSLERDIENPKESEIFASYPRILADAVMLDFIVDYLRLIISGNMNTFEIEALMDEEIETHESEAEVPANQSGDGGGFAACLWYCRGGNGGWFTLWLQPIVRQRSWGR
ncbi:motility protein A [Salmonella enterica subsp. enterica]|uniref:Motility protein A n=1 Tax=Salmonella enterica I TaxID=59201 RepID=A0A447N8Q7_SALET|nr:motility protein A [Salmonella enterica subsp. enterica]